MISVVSCMNNEKCRNQIMEVSSVMRCTQRGMGIQSVAVQRVAVGTVYAGTNIIVSVLFNNVGRFAAICYIYIFFPCSAAAEHGLWPPHS
jgi:hypothetical protein